MGRWEMINKIHNIRTYEHKENILPIFIMKTFDHSSVLFFFVVCFVVLLLLFFFHES